MQSAGVMASAKHFIGNEQEHFRQIVESIDYGYAQCLRLFSTLIKADLLLIQIQHYPTGLK